jgi:REP element-mobilizing transposase RayT
MPRPLRPPDPEGIYHVTARGVERRAVFRDDDDRELFMRILCATAKRRRWEIWAWCLMTTHYHLVVRAPDGDLSRGMQWLNGRYADWFNVGCGRPGHLWQGRFHSVRVEQQEHLVELARYVARNPVEGGLCRRAEDWPWSHHGALLGVRDPLLADAGVLRMFHPDDVGQARWRYAAFVERADPDAIGGLAA